jgi:hypothetical protein
MRAQVAQVAQVALMTRPSQGASNRIASNQVPLLPITEMQVRKTER